MKDRFFADSNVLLYLLDKENKKKIKAEELLFQTPIISTQVINENINVARKRFRLSKHSISYHIENLILKCEVSIITTNTIQLALTIFNKYQYSYYDCLIISSGLEANCKILYSEDMQHNQLIEKKLRIINPFL